MREQTERLAAPLSAEDQMVQSCPEASPVKWHRAHTTWFFETFILAQDPDYQPFDPEFRWLFNSYYNGVSDQPARALRAVFSRPSCEQIARYRAYVDQHMVQFLGRDLPEDMRALVELGLNHEQQHQELIVTDIKHALWSNPLRPGYVNSAPARLADAAPSLRWVQFDGGIVEIGHTGHGFAFDNELPRHQVLLQPYQLASRLVTSGEYIQFLRDGGYQRPELWLSAGWEWVKTRGVTAPLYWEGGEEHWRHYTLHGMRDVDASEPACHVNYFEADAYARWAGARLATEFEWEKAASVCAIEGNFAGSGGLQPANAEGGPADLTQMFGDCWEWTSSAYAPYPGFKAAAGALGEYNGKFMCNQYVLRGGSCATPQPHIRASYRNFFPPEARWQFTGIRLAKDGAR